MMPYSFLSTLECARCQREYQFKEQAHLCSCGSPLLAHYDLDRARQEWSRRSLQGREASLWRYHELLPVQAAEHVVTLGKGWTLLLPLSRLGKTHGFSSLLLKDEGTLPTGSFRYSLLSNEKIHGIIINVTIVTFDFRYSCHSGRYSSEIIREERAILSGYTQKRYQ